MMRKARLAIRKVNVALDSPGYCFGTGRSLKLVCFPALAHVLPPRGSIRSPRKLSGLYLLCRKPHFLHS